MCTKYKYRAQWSNKHEGNLLAFLIVEQSELHHNYCVLTSNVSSNICSIFISVYCLPFSCNLIAHNNIQNSTKTKRKILKALYKCNILK